MDINTLTSRIAEEATAEEEGEVEESGKNPSAVALGRLGGLKGGRARALSLSAEARSSIARKAAAARWGKNVSS